VIDVIAPFVLWARIPARWLTVPMRLERWNLKQARWLPNRSHKQE